MQTNDLCSSTISINYQIPRNMGEKIPKYTNHLIDLQ